MRPARITCSTALTRAVFAVAIVIAITIAGCFKPPPPPTASSHGRDRAAEEASARRLREFPLSAARGAVRLRLLASAPPTIAIAPRNGSTPDAAEPTTERSPAATSFDADLEGSGLHCTVERGDVRLGHRMEEWVARTHFELLDRPVVDVDSESAHPILFFEVHAARHDARGRTYGFAWLAGAYLEDASIACFYGGQDPTLFRGVIRHLVRQASEPLAQPSSFRLVTETFSRNRPLASSTSASTAKRRRMVHASS